MQEWDGLLGTAHLRKQQQPDAKCQALEWQSKAGCEQQAGCHCQVPARGTEKLLQKLCECSEELLRR